MDLSKKMEQSFDILVIGSGPGGYVAALRAKQLGFNVAIVEKEQLGGTCLNWGCIPTKALLHCADVLHHIKCSSAHGVTVKNVSTNLASMIEYSRQVANRLSNGVRGLLRKNGVEVFYGMANIVGDGYVHVTQSICHPDVAPCSLYSKNIILATGSRARELPNVPVDHKMVLNYRDILMLKEMPQNLLIVGGGVMGCEFATFYSALGVNVTIIEASSRLLASEDAEIVDIMRKSFVERGIKIFTHTSVSDIQPHNNKVKVVLTHDNGHTSIEIYDKVLAVVGLVPNTQNIGLENTEIQLNTKGFIQVDESYKTKDKHIYAIGDVIGAPMLAHKASHEGIVCVEKIAGRHTHTIKNDNIPGCIYSNPQIASIGITEENALKKEMNIKIGRFPGMGNGKAIALGEDKYTMVKAIFHAVTGELLGLHMVGPTVTEMIYGMSVLKEMEGTEEDLRRTIFPHPTLSEMIHEASLAAYERALHI